MALDVPDLRDGLGRNWDPSRRLGELLGRHRGAPVELDGGRRGRGGRHVQVLAHLLLLAHAGRLGQGIDFGVPDVVTLSGNSFKSVTITDCHNIRPFHSSI